MTKKKEKKTVALALAQYAPCAYDHPSLSGIILSHAHAMVTIG